MEATTLGVEEEFQLLDPASLALTSAAPALLAVAGRPELVGELPLSQVEAVTPVCGSLAEVRAQVTRLRGLAADAAVATGSRLASCGTAPLAEWRLNAASDDPKYDALKVLAGHLVAEQLIAGLHVHVGVPDAERAVAVLDRSRAWLPVLLALSASSPMWAGRDSGFASWRTVHWRRWPVSGPPPHFGSAQGYAGGVAALLATGVVARESQVYWDARRSVSFPTVEFRVADAVHTVDEAVMVAGLVRGLARAALADHDAGIGLDPLPDAALRVATWLAARHGLTGGLVDPESGLTSAAPQVVRRLLDRVRPHLGDEAADVEEPVARLLVDGTGSDRQRAAATRGGLRAAAELVVAETVAGVPRAGLPRVHAPAGGDLDASDRALAADRPPHHG